MAYFRETRGDISRRENDRIERENREYRERRSDSNERARERQERAARERREFLARQQREAEAQRREQERLNKERQAAEARQRERLEYERRVATEQKEKERVARERRELLARQQREAEAQRREQERLSKERQAAEARKRERERLEYERRVATERKEKERVARERKELLARQRREAEAKRREQERLNKERQAAEARKRERERLEYERRVATEQKEKERVARERKELLARQQREAKAQKEHERLVQEMLERSKAIQREQAKKAEAQRRERERLEYERRVATERKEKERVARVRKELLARQQREAEAKRREQERLNKERQAAEARKRERERLEYERRVATEQKEKERVARVRKELLARHQREAEAKRREQERLSKGGNIANNKKQNASKVGNVASNNKKSAGNVANLIAHAAISAAKQPIIKTKPNSVSHNKPATSNVDTSKSTIRLSPAELQALAMEASYADFSEFDGKKVKEALADSKNFNSLRKAEAFVDNFTMLAQLPNSRHGSSAIILKNKHSGYIHWVARGTELTDIQDAITDARLTISGRPKYQELEQLNFYSRLSTPKNQPAPQYEYAKQYITGPNKMAMKVDNTDKIVLKKSTAPGLGVINKTDYIEFNGHSLAMSLGEGLRYVIPNPSKIYGANGAGLRQSSANKKFYEETRKLVSGSTTAIDWNKYNSSSTNTVTTGKPTIVASNTAVLPQNGSIQKLPQPINGTEGHRISHFTQSQITKVMVESIGLNYQEFVRKHQEAHNKQVIRERTNGTMRNEIHTLINHEKLAINRIARFLGNARRYTEPSGTETEKEAIDKNNKDLLMDLRLRTPLLDPKQKRQLQEILNKPVEPLELSKRGTTPTLNSNIARQTDSLIQAMAIANKGREGEVELTNLSASSDISLTFNHT